MTGLVRKATLLAVCGLLTAGVAMAHVPDPANSECPTGCIYVVGHNGTVGDRAGAFCVTVRDFNNVPIENSSVIIDFSNCDLQLCINQLDAGVIVDCVSQTVRKLTDVTGKACFRIIGKARPSLGCTNVGANCVRIFADSTPLCSVNAAVFDLVNDPAGNGLGAGDLSAWLSMFFCPGAPNPHRGDYICDGVLGAGDLSRWLTVFFGNYPTVLNTPGSTLNCPPPKDNNVGPKCQ